MLQNGVSHVAYGRKLAVLFVDENKILKNDQHKGAVHAKSFATFTSTIYSSLPGWREAP